VNAVVPNVMQVNCTLLFLVPLKHSVAKFKGIVGYCIKANATVGTVIRVILSINIITLYNLHCKLIMLR
jgi:hypothetical protein